MSKSSSKSASRILALTLLSASLVAAPVIAYAASDDQNPKPPATNTTAPAKGKKAKKSSSIDSPKFLAGYHAAYATIYDRHDYAGAIEQLKALGQDDRADVANLIGYSYRKLGDYKVSQIWYERALQADPNHVRTWQYYGLWQLEQGNREQAAVSPAEDRPARRHVEQRISIARLGAREAAGHRPRLLRIRRRISPNQSAKHRHNLRGCAGFVLSGSIEREAYQGLWCCNGCMVTIRGRLHRRLARISTDGIATAGLSSIAIVHRGEIAPNMPSASPISTPAKNSRPRHRFRIASHSKSVHRRRHHEAARAAQTAARRSCRAICRRSASARRRARPSRNCCRTARASPATAPIPDSSSIRRPYLNAKEVACRVETAARDRRPIRASNIPTTALRLARPRDRSHRRRALPRLDQARDRRCRRPARNRCRTCRLPKGTPFARGHTRRLPLGRRLVDPRRQSRARDGVRRGLCRHRRRHRALLRATGAERKTQRAFRRKPPRDDAQAMAHRRRASRCYYGLGVASGKTDGWDWFGHGGGFQGYISRTAVVPECDVAISILSNSIDGAAPVWIDGCFTSCAPSRRAARRIAALRDWTGRWWTDVGRDRSRAHGQPRAGRQSASSSIRSWTRPRSRSPAATPAASPGRPAMRSHGEPVRRVAQQGRQGHRHLVRRRQRQAGKGPGRGDRAQIRARQAARQAMKPRRYFINACTSLRNAWREASRE